MELIVGLMSLTVALGAVGQAKLAFPSNLAATAFVSLVLYIMTMSLAAYTANLLMSVTHMASSVPAFIPVALVLGAGAGYLFGRRGSSGGDGRFRPF